MDFDAFIDQAWTDHATDPATVAATLQVQGLARVTDAAQLASMAHLAHHVFGSHLARWEEGLQFQQQLAALPCCEAGSTQAQAIARHISALRLAGGLADDRAGMGASDRIRLNAMAANNLVEHDAGRAEAFMQAALSEAAKALLAKLPEDVEALQAYAGAQAANGDLAGAKTTLTNAARRAAFDAPRLLEVARQQVSIKDYSGAAYSLDKALSGTPDYVPAQAMLSSIDLAQGDAVKAEQRAKQVIQAAPKSAIGYNLLAEVATYRGQATAAIDALRKAHDIEKSQASLARLMRAVGNQSGPKAAIELGEGWLKRNPSDLAVRNAVAEQNLRARDFAAARKQYETILSQRPSHADTLNNLANVLMVTKDPGAVDMAERAYKVDTRNPKLMDTAGWANHLAGKDERALQLLREARLRAPDEPEIRYHLAAVLAKAGRKGEAREELNAALRPSVSFASLEDAKKLLSTLN